MIFYILFSAVCIGSLTVMYILSVEIETAGVVITLILLIFFIHFLVRSRIETSKSDQHFISVEYRKYLSYLTLLNNVCFSLFIFEFISRESFDYDEILSVASQILNLIFLLLAGTIILRLIAIEKNHFESRKEFEENENDYRKNKAEKLFKRIDKIVKEEGLYLNSNFMLSDLSLKLSTNTKYISQAINQCCHQNFTYYLNDMRISHFKAEIRKEKNKNKTIQAVAYESGFSSIATFNRIFKTQTGMTPSDYLRNLQ